MADDGARCHAVGPHRGGNPELHREDGGLNPIDTGHRLRCHHRRGDRETGLGGDQRLELSDLGREHRLGGQQSDAHRRPLRPLAGKHPHRSAVVLTDGGLERVIATGDCPQAFDQDLAAVGDDGIAHGAVTATAGQRVGEVAQVQVIARGLDPVGQALRGLTKAIHRGGRDRKNQLLNSRAGDPSPAVGRSRLGGLLEHGVHVGARHAVRGDRSAPRGDTLIHRPAGGLLGHEQPGLDFGQVIGELIEVQVLRDDTVVDRKHGLHQTQHAGSGLGVPEIALDRGERAGTLIAVDGRDAVELDGVTDRGSGAVRFDHADSGGFDARGRQCRTEDRDLGITRGSQDVVGAAVLVRRGAANDGEYPVAITLGIVEPFEHDDTAAFSAYETIGLDVEGVAASGRRQHSLTGCGGVEARIEHQHHTAGERHLALALMQAAAGLMHRDHAR